MQISKKQQATKKRIIENLKDFKADGRDDLFCATLKQFQDLAVEVTEELNYKLLEAAKKWPNSETIKSTETLLWIWMRAANGRIRRACLDTSQTDLIEQIEQIANFFIYHKPAAELTIENPKVGEYSLCLDAEIDYISAEGHATKRQITIQKYLNFGEEYSRIHARCHLRDEQRTFYVHKIKEFVDLRTGEIVPNIYDYLLAEAQKAA